ncbi:MAG: (2Fe-2S)-binding protein [Porticoccaceae bacterium]|jgi:isoquinoline 1-oxidoreductase alpha subunit|tara:strand:+ start:997 stop:1467 length:471 start_codon:yes stop_codon:yes gene_type:complete
MQISLKVNGVNRKIEAEADTPLLWVLRDTIDMKGTKYGCGIAQCGACTVHLNGVAIRSCVTPINQVANQEITTIEGLETVEGLAIQAAWDDLSVVQCGYCQSGQIMSASALLAYNAMPNDDDIDAAMSGNICRCGTYGRIRAAVKQASQAINKEDA